MAYRGHDVNQLINTVRANVAALALAAGGAYQATKDAGYGAWVGADRTYSRHVRPVVKGTAAAVRTAGSAAAVYRTGKSIYRTAYPYVPNRRVGYRAVRRWRGKVPGRGAGRWNRRYSAKRANVGYPQGQRRFRRRVTKSSAAGRRRFKSRRTAGYRPKYKR